MIRKYIKHIIPILALLPSLIYAQTGIGTKTPDASAAIELNSSSKGLLLPRVGITNKLDKTTIANPATGLMIYKNTATSGTTPNIVDANKIYAWQGLKWDRFVTLDEVKTAKKPVDLALLTKIPQAFDQQEINNLNSSTTNTIEITWIPTDVLYANPSDISGPNANKFSFITSSNYDISGTFTFKPITQNSKATAVLISLQKLVGTTWTTISGALQPLEEQAVGNAQSVIFSNIIHHFNAGDQIRFVISKPYRQLADNNYPSANNYELGTGIAGRLPEDIKKSVRITRIRE